MPKRGGTPTQLDLRCRFRGSESRRRPGVVHDRLRHLREPLQLSGQACAGRSHPDPEVAARFPKVSADGKTQIIQLKRVPLPYRPAGHGGELRRSDQPRCEPKAGSYATPYMHEIVGVDAVLDGKAQTVSGVTTRGPYTLRIRTTRSLPGMVSRLTCYFCPVAVGTPPEEIDDPLGSGPYYIASRVPNRQVVLERNRFYRGRRPANVDRVVWTVGPARRPAGRRSSRTRSIGASSSPNLPNEASPRPTGSTSPTSGSISIRRSRPGTSPSTMTERRSRGQARSHSSRRSTGRSIARRSCAPRASSAANAPTRYCRPPSRDGRASTRLEV